MRRLVPATFILFGIILVYIFSCNYVTNICHTTTKMIEDCENRYKNGEYVAESSEKLQKFWDKKEKILSVFVSHNQIDEIEMAISSLNIYAKSPNNIKFYEYSDTVKTLIHQLLEDTKISAHSVF